MARHSHWHQIRLKKGVADKKRGKIFTKHARLIEVAAAAAGGDPNMNASLRLAIENARADNMPRENIERAIKKGTGELKGAAKMEEMTYEGYAPGGIALIIDTLTDNKNRTSQFVRTTLEKLGGNLGATGSASFLFETKGRISVKSRGNADTDELDIIDAGAQDLEKVDDGFYVYTTANDLGIVKKILQEKGFIISSAEIVKLPKDTIEISSADAAKKLLDLMDALEESDDVVNIAANFAIADGVL